MVLPVGLTIISIIWDTDILIIPVLICIFLAVALIPGFRHRENLGVSILTAICGLPFNIRLSYYCVHEVFFLNGLGEVLYFILFMLILFSLEEIVLGVIARLIWPRQYRFSFLTGKR